MANKQIIFRRDQKLSSDLDLQSQSNFMSQKNNLRMNRWVQQLTAAPLIRESGGKNKIR